MPQKVVVGACAACFVLGMVGLYLLAHVASAVIRRGQENRRRRATQPEKAKPAEPSIIKRCGAALERFGTMNFILLVLGIMLYRFTMTMIDVFRECEAVPDTLINCVFLATTGECGVMGWIKTSKVKRREREWRKEDANTVRLAEEPPAEDGPSMGAG